MNNKINLSGLTELTEDFLSSSSYPHIHRSWSEWETSAREYGLTDEQIEELNRYLEQNQQLTVPIIFNNRRWWLTKQEIKHVDLIKKHFPESWEDHVDQLMGTLSLGNIKEDYKLKTRIKNHATKTLRN
ncbi:hypothetical protein L2E71_22200 [Planktothrix agardhii 1032]|jgi:glutaredoxin|uniref:hypothetical protein n=1 Tax=Planktothrix agardhii TaxID=1160 RepID=UPI001D0B0D48|nr:hypothetical protein [Planktothrix agardhii]MCB8780238.1 hypothetical protein [Planktothrix agardhii 1031]MCF3600781.1 hypothetical protein [Planktothrix agardhii 1032]MCF3647520.1 hypothetical protein [Planktothrix agardhii 1026]CAD5984512.1 hypothetical protein PCC7811_04483 [Planktothrix agardhii]